MLDDFKMAIDKLEKIENRYNEINELLSDMEIINDQNKYKEFSKELSNIEETVLLFKSFKETIDQFKQNEILLKEEKDNDILEMAKEEKAELSKNIEQMKFQLKRNLIPPDPMADKNIIVEIRAGTGGEEASLFAMDLFKMYSRFAEMKKWKIEVIDMSESGVGGVKEIVFNVTGKNVYENLRFESGGHRVQRIPVTESGGRIHTSAVTVAVLPEAEEAEVQINNDDLRIDVLRSSGAGGQHVNKTESCVRVTHIPTGIAIRCQDTRSQHKNKAQAMKVLRSRLYEMQQNELNKERSTLRKDQVGSGDRSDKVRTYNYPQNRVTDHRINMTLYKLDQFMIGNIDEIIEALKIHFYEQRMKEVFSDNKS